MNRDNLISVCGVVDVASDDLAEYLREITALLKAHYENYEIVLIGNGLAAATLLHVQQLVSAHPRSRLLVLANNYDEDIAYSAALDTAIGDVVVLLDYRSDPVGTVLDMIDRVLGGADIVLGNNLNPDSNSIMYSLLSRTYYGLSEFLVSGPLEFDRTYFSCYSRTAVNLMTRDQSKIRNLRFLRKTIGLASESISYHQKPRVHPEAQTNIIGRIFARAEEALSFSVRPLRLISMLCLLASMVNVLYALYVLMSKIILSHVAPGWASAQLAQSAMLSVAFFAISIEAIHLNIILQEVRHRPLYTALNEFPSSHLIRADTRKNVVDVVE